VDDAEAITIGTLNELERVVEVIVRDILAGGEISIAAPTVSINGNNSAGGNCIGGRLSTLSDLQRILSEAEVELCTHLPAGTVQWY